MQGKLQGARRPPDDRALRAGGERAGAPHEARPDRVPGRGVSARAASSSRRRASSSVPTSPSPSSQEPDRRDRSRDPRGDLRLRPALPPRRRRRSSPDEVMGHEAVGTVEARRRRRPAVAARRSGRRRRSTSPAARAGSAAAADAAVRGASGSSARARSAAIWRAPRREFVRVPVADVNLLPVPDGVDDERALFVGDVLTTGVYAASLAGAAPGDVVAVIGAGPGRLSARRSRCGPRATDEVVVARPRPSASRARSRGRRGDRRHAGRRTRRCSLARRTDDRGADVVIDAVGAPDAFEHRDRRRCAAAAAWSSSGMYAGETVGAAARGRAGRGRSRLRVRREIRRCTRGGSERWPGSPTGTLDPLPLDQPPAARWPRRRPATRCSSDARRRRWCSTRGHDVVDERRADRPSASWSMACCARTSNARPSAPGSSPGGRPHRSWPPTPRWP